MLCRTGHFAIIYNSNNWMMGGRELKLNYEKPQVIVHGNLQEKTAGVSPSAPI
ncbi:MAG TPA: hypothetical protein DER60_11050 [Syntrophomonas sp.]|nr:hypothetical protein [Syntrophomonas sp.]